MKSMVNDDMVLMLNSKDAAQLCGCSWRLWRIWDRMGYTPMPVKIGTRLFWKHQELIQWIDAGCPKREVWVRSLKPGITKKASEISLSATPKPRKRGQREKYSK